MRKQLFFILFGLIILFFPFNLKSQNAQVESGIYYGNFPNTSTVIFYDVSGGSITPIGFSLEFESVKILDENSLEISFYKNNLMSIICNKLDIKKNDYGKTKTDSISEFNGLHYGPLVYENEYSEGIILAIKNLPSGEVLITLLKLEDFSLYKTTGKILIENNCKYPHKTLKFNVCGEINNYKNEEWGLTYNFLTFYKYDNFFSIYINGEYRFQVEVIDNGIK